MSMTLDLSTNYKQSETFEYNIGDEMFESVEKSLVKGGCLVAKVKAQADSIGLDLQFNISGQATVECDRCLDDMQIDINCEESLKVQFADQYEETDEVIYLTHNQTELDLWPIIYDFIALAIPLVHVHPEGQCNQEMLNKLNQYMVTQIEEQDEE